MQICRNIAPAVVTFLQRHIILQLIRLMMQKLSKLLNWFKTLQEQFQRKSERVHYFNGISDSSYLNFSGDMSQIVTYQQNAPNFNQTYSDSFEAIQVISAPTIFCGPIGKDAHKLSERLHKNSAFIELPFVLTRIVKSYI